MDAVDTVETHFHDEDLLKPDPADDAQLYPTVVAWLPARRSRASRRVVPHENGASQGRTPAQVHELIQILRRDTIPVLAETPETSPQPVSQSAFSESGFSQPDVTPCTIFPELQFPGVDMHKPAPIRSSDSLTVPMRTAPAARPIADDAASGFLHSSPPPLGERLDVYGARWLQALPVTVRPLITAKRHPHIVNRFAILWGDADAVNAYFDSLLISARPGRRGFATEVLDELVELQRAVQEQHAPHRLGRAEGR